MKRILIALLMLAVVLSAAACAKDDTPDTPDVPDTTDSMPADTEETPAAPAAKNETELKAGVYTATSSYSAEGMNMTWNFVLTLKADGTFLLTDAEGTEKGTGTYALTDDCYTLTYADERSCTLAALADGTLKITADFPYGTAQIKLSMVGDIVFGFAGEIPADTTPAETTPAEEPSVIYTITPGIYMASYEKVSAMAGTVVYNYVATILDDGTFAYSVAFEMGGAYQEGVSAAGTYKVDGNTFTFTDSEGNVIEGKLTAENTLTISLKASTMAKDPYEVTFEPMVEAG